MSLGGQGRILCFVAILTGVVTSLAGACAAPTDSQVNLLQMRTYTGPELTDRSPAIWPHATGNFLDRAVAIAVGDGLSATLPNPVGYYAINMIEVDEEGGNNPCFLKLWGNMVDPRYAINQKQRVLAQYELAKCGSFIQSVDLGKTGFEPSQSRFIRAVRICRHMHPSGDFELKGVGVKAGEVSSGSAAVTPREQEVHGFIRANCPDHRAADSVGNPSREDLSGWTIWDECPNPESELAIGVTVFVHDEKYFSGMTVLCKVVSAAFGPTPVTDGWGY